MASRLASVTVLLVGIAGLSAVLAVDSARSVYRHETTARQVLTDYTALGAEAVAQRLQTALAGRLYAIVNTVGDSLPPTREKFVIAMRNYPAFAEIITWAGQRGNHGKTRIARYDTAATISEHLDDSLRAATSRLSESAYMGAFANGNTLVVFAKPRMGVTTGIIAMPFPSLQGMLEKFLINDPVLPQSITHQKPLGNGVEVAVYAGKERLAIRGAAAESRFRAEHAIGTPFSNMSVVVRLAEYMAPALVIGGLPRSQLPFLVVMLTLTVLLAATALYQLRSRERLTRLREDFVAGTSHELRTPLAQIRLFSDTLRLERVRSEEERAHALTVIDREARRLEHLVENLLHFSRGEHGVQSLSPEELNLGTLTREIVSEFTPLAAKSGVTLFVENISSPVLVVDASAWRQVVLNLLDNAAKYGGRGSRVSVSLADEQQAVSLIVADEGPGIPRNERDRIWEKFWRGESARSAGITGAGVGLATVRDLVTRMGGTCNVDDAIPKGSRFRVQLHKHA